MAVDCTKENFDKTIESWHSGIVGFLDSHAIKNEADLTKLIDGLFDKIKSYIQFYAEELVKFILDPIGQGGKLLSALRDRLLSLVDRIPLLGQEAKDKYKKTINDIHDGILKAFSNDDGLEGGARVLAFLVDALRALFSWSDDNRLKQIYDKLPIPSFLRVALNTVFTALKELVTFVVGKFKGKIATFVLTLLPKAVKLLTKHLRSGGVLSGAIRPIVANALSNIPIIGKYLPDLLDTITDRIVDRLEPVLDGVVDRLSKLPAESMLDVVISTTRKTLDSLSGILKGNAEAASGYVDTAVKWVSDNLEGVLSELTIPGTELPLVPKISRSIIMTAVNAALSAVGATIKGILSTATKLNSLVNDVFNKVLEGASKVVPGLVSKGVGVIMGLLNKGYSAISPVIYFFGRPLVRLYGIFKAAVDFVFKQECLKHMAASAMEMLCKLSTVLSRV